MKYDPIIIVIFLLANVFIFGCRKDENGGNSPSPRQYYKYMRVVEYGTMPSTPVEGVNFTICTRPVVNYGVSDRFNCSDSGEELVSDKYGKVNFNGNQLGEFGLIGGTKDGYWPIDEKLITFYEIWYSPHDPGGVHTADSSIVKLVPKVKVNLHVQNKNANLQRDVDLYVTGIFETESYSRKLLENINLRPGIDTSFQVELFGNTNNLIQVYYIEHIDDYYYYDTIISYFEETKNLGRSDELSTIQVIY